MKVCYYKIFELMNVKEMEYAKCRKKKTVAEGSRSQGSQNSTSMYSQALLGVAQAVLRLKRPLLRSAG
jgi:hypothetical protein